MEFDLKCGYFNLDKRLTLLREIAKLKGVPVISDSALAVLLMLIKTKRPKKILELGTASGLSALAMLSCSDAAITTIEKDQNILQAARQNFAEFNAENKVESLCGDAAEVLQTLSDTYDFIFLDSAKSQYKNYHKRLVELLNSGGVLLADNVLFRGQVLDGQVPPARHRTIVKNLRVFLENLKNDERLDTALIDVGDGLSVSIKK